MATSHLPAGEPPHPRVPDPGRRLAPPVPAGVVMVGGAVGALARFSLDEALPAAPGGWPWATLVANLAACLLLGYVATALPAGGSGRALLGSGFCGALSTFSALQVEVLTIGRGGHAALAAAYAASDVAP